ncbi:MAG TPA: UvrD-helicase domain-containing protein, partial [Stellaceae bacterium]|nr:UvrD-helicase domain-containing protein [Stellaceae bacterium]
MTGARQIDPQRAAAAPNASVWVGASAGTGKTKVLTDRVLALLLAGSDPGRILCLTFTKAAAAEMSNRLHDRLADWAVASDGQLAQHLVALVDGPPDPDLMARARRLFARVLDTPGGMKIETLHAFCQSLLRRFPLEAGIAPHFDVMDERAQTEALAEARDAMLLAARQGEDAPLAGALAEVTRHAAETTFDALFANLIDERARLAPAVGDGLEPDRSFSSLPGLTRQSLDPRVKPGGDEIEEDGSGPAESSLRERLARALGIAPDETPERVVAAACAGVDPRLAAMAHRLRASQRDGDCGQADAIEHFFAALPQDRPARFDAWCGIFFTQGGTTRVNIITKSFAATVPDIDAALRAEAQRLVAFCARRAAAHLLRATLAITELGAAILGLYRRHKKDRALLDYDDLVFAARDLLCGKGAPPWVLFKLDGGIDHILIDEAQDTNPQQWDVVQKLADEFFVGLSQREVPRTIFAVGDPKQSIFSFQGADPSRFSTMRDHFAGRAGDAEAPWARVALERSFRSTACVLSAVDGVFARDPARDGVADGAADVIRHVAHRAGMGGRVELWPPVGPGDAAASEPWELPLEQRRTVEPPVRLAHTIAEAIRLWIARGERLEARDRLISPGDVLVLVRRRTSFVTALMRALKQRGIAVAGSDRMRLFDQLAVEDMVALLQFLLLQEDDLTLATVLKGPLVALDEEHLFRLAFARGEGASLWSELRRRAGEDPEFSRAHALLQDLLARVDYAPPYELIAEILGARGGRRRFVARLGPEAADPLDELLAAALAYERRHGTSLQGFLHWLGTSDIEVKRDFDVSPRDEVRIMTVHGAKGLQAPVVFLPDTMAVPLAPTPSLVWTEDGLPLWRAHPGCGAPALDRASALAAQERAREYRRLLYVAMTRAEDRLYVCGWHGKRAPPADSWYELVSAGLAAAPGVEPFPFAAPIADRWEGTGLRLVTEQTARAADDHRWLAGLHGPVELPHWYRRAPRPEPSPPRPLAPSRPQ